MGDEAESGWQWDRCLYGGSAGFYPRGRVPYPLALVDLLVSQLGLDSQGRLLDLGCGPGSLTLPLAAHVAEVVGVDADEDMLAEAERQAVAVGATNATWVHRRAEDLSTDIGPFRAVTMAQSFHWMDRDRVARLVHGLLADEGVLAFVHATTHQGVDSTARLAHPRPPRLRVEALVAKFLGENRRAGRGHRKPDDNSETERGRIEARIFEAAGFSGPVRVEVPGWVVERSAEDVVASVFSLSYAAPHLFGDRLGEFERDLHELLGQTSPSGQFSEQMREIAVDFWRRSPNPQRAHSTSLFGSEE